MTSSIGPFKEGTVQHLQPQGGLFREQEEFCTPQNSLARTPTHTHLRVRLYLKLVVTEMALHPELKDGRTIILAHRHLLRIVPHTYMGVSESGQQSRGGWGGGGAGDSPIPTWFPHPAHQILKGSSNL